jgi:hypothetical protein
MIRVRCAAAALFGLLLAGLLTASAVGQGQKPAKGKVIETKGAPGKLAAKVDFGALGLNLSGLGTLGARIDQARAAADPVALSLLAKELAVAESISKKQAKIKASDLYAEAVELAKLRQNHDELKALALIVPGKDVKEDLGALATKVAKSIEDRKNGEKTRGIGGSLHVDSRVGLYIDIYVNGIYRGTVSPFGDIYNIFVGDPGGLDTILYGRAPGTSRVWGPSRVSGAFGNYTWQLYP